MSNRFVPRVPVVMLYHSVRNDLADSIYRIAITPTRFQRHVEFLASHYRVVGLEEFLGAADSRAKLEGMACITFDDGYADNLLAAKDILSRQGLPATVYVPTGYVGRPYFWWDALQTIQQSATELRRSDTKSLARMFPSIEFTAIVRDGDWLQVWDHLRRLPLDLTYGLIEELARRLAVELRHLPKPVGAAELKSLARWPFEIGSHAVSHRPLSALSIADLRSEVIGSRELLEDATGRQVRTISYPFGLFNREVAQACRDAGYLSGVSLAEGHRASYDDHFDIPRIDGRDGDVDELALELSRFDRANETAFTRFSARSAKEAPRPRDVLPPSHDRIFQTAVSGRQQADLPSDASDVKARGVQRAQESEFHFFCDEVSLDAKGQLEVVGWALCTHGISEIIGYFDNRKVGNAQLGILRDDVGASYSHVPMASYAGFRLSERVEGASSGEHVLRLEFRNTLDQILEDVHTIRPRGSAASSVAASEFLSHIDTPVVVAGNVEGPVIGGLTIDGWALARSGILRIEVLIDEQHLGDAHYGATRKDVNITYPDWPDSLRSGFAFHCPPYSLQDGSHTVLVRLHARNGEVLQDSFRIEVQKFQNSSGIATIRRKMMQVEVDVWSDVLSRVGYHPRFLLIVCYDGNSGLAPLHATIETLREQVYRDWHLTILAKEPSQVRLLRKFVADRLQDIGNQIDVMYGKSPLMRDRLIAGAGDDAEPEFVGIVSAGDLLACDALMQFALASGRRRYAEMLYSDEVRIDAATGHSEPFLKPELSPDLLLSTNYIGRLWFASAALVTGAAITLGELWNHGEYDAVLRCTERARHVHRIPLFLCARNASPPDTAEQEVAALQRAAVRRRLTAEVIPGLARDTWRFVRSHPASALVSIIIPTCAAGGHIRTCITTLRERTAYKHFEIVCVENIPADRGEDKAWLRENADKVVSVTAPFNWSVFNNRGAQAASGKILLFLNDDIEVDQAGWLDALLEHAQRPEVAIVGAQLRYPDGKIQHAGMFLASNNIARHAFRFAASDDPGYFGLALTQRNVIAVTGACMMIRRGVYEALKGFDEKHAIINNDLDFCLRAHEAGKLIVYTPYASLVHHESASRDKLEETFDTAAFEARWSRLFAAGDPYFNPRLSRNADDYRLDDEPVELTFARYPMFRHAEIKRILVVKVDHIGDFVTALPAIRRLKQLFPAASICVLASPASKVIGQTEKCIDEFIEFEYFHTVSGQGAKDISSAEYDALRERLSAYRFDIAVDLRKFFDTRELLLCTSARFLVGYDHMGQHPYLDISLEWEADKRERRKRSHVTHDLLNLVEAIGSAADSDIPAVEPGAAAGKAPAFLPGNVRALFSKPVMVVHVGVGNVVRQWPAEHFISLIDRIVEGGAANAILVGGQEDKELAEHVLARVSHRASVASLTGVTSLQQLSELLSCCALYVGNNSGPKHVAASLGVPTIGVHSGVVDPIEWGPIGRRAVAIRRNMSCSPCYIAQAEDCPRGFACMRDLSPAAVSEVAVTLLGRALEIPAESHLVEAKPRKSAPKMQKPRLGARPQQYIRRPLGRLGRRDLHK